MSSYHLEYNPVSSPVGCCCHWNAKCPLV